MTSIHPHPSNPLTLQKHSSSMREVSFIKKNADQWKEVEQILVNDSDAHPDRLGDLYVQLTDDLSYSRTFYPKSKTSAYLNQLAAQVHRFIYRNKREKWSRLFDFWKYEVPLAVFSTRKELKFSIGIFIISVLIGLISQLHDPGIARVVLGDSYVNQTLDNINQNDPMAIYKSMDQGPMYFFISSNNIKVSFMMFVSGISFGVFTLYLMFQNGFLLGAFVGFFYQKGLLWVCLSTLLIHGTLELSALIISGAAGFAIGRALCFPGTYTRIQSLREAGKRALKIAVALVPVFALAAIFESYVTRHYKQMPEILKVSIILFSLALIVSYFFVYPGQFEKTKTQINESEYEN